MGEAHCDEGLEFKNRAFSAAELQLVQGIVADRGRLSRQALANTVCERLDWRRPNGGLKTWHAGDEAREGAGALHQPPQVGAEGHAVAGRVVARHQFPPQAPLLGAVHSPERERSQLIEAGHERLAGLGELVVSENSAGLLPVPQSG